MDSVSNSQEHIRRKVLFYWISMEDRLYLFRCSFPLALALTTLVANGLSSAIGWFLSAIVLDTGTLIWRRNVKKHIMSVDIERCWQDAGLFHVAAVTIYTIAGFNWVLSSPSNYVVTAIVFGASLMTHCSWVPTMRIWSNVAALLLPFSVLDSAKRQALFRKEGVQFICFPGRLNFETPHQKEESSAWFGTWWVCHGLQLPSQIVFWEWPAVLPDFKHVDPEYAREDWL